jgi:hypothetical protein
MCVCLQFGCRNKDSEPGDLIGKQSALWQARGREEAESLSQLLLDELHRRLVITQTMVVQARQGAQTTGS